MFLLKTNHTGSGKAASNHAFRSKRNTSGRL